MRRARNQIGAPDDLTFMRQNRWKVAVLAAGMWWLLSGVGGAHTDADAVAVPAGQEATVHFRPAHGCGDAPTVKVSVRAPVAGALAGPVDGWTATATPDGDGRTVLEWTGGRLLTDQHGAFPVTFTAPGMVGELLTFPAVQECENGEELAWISGDPKAEFPAPRLLVLPPGTEAAATIDDVPADAPGREQLVAVVDVDNPAGSPTAVDVRSTSTSSPSAPETVAVDEQPGAGADDGGGGIGWLPLVAAGLVIVASGGAAVASRRRKQSPMSPV